MQCSTLWAMESGQSFQYGGYQLQPWYCWYEPTERKKAVECLQESRPRKKYRVPGRFELVQRSSRGWLVQRETERGFLLGSQPRCVRCWPRAKRLLWLYFFWCWQTRETSHISSLPTSLQKVVKMHWIFIYQYDRLQKRRLLLDYVGKQLLVCFRIMYSKQEFCRNLRPYTRRKNEYLGSKVNSSRK